MICGVHGGRSSFLLWILFDGVFFRFGGIGYSGAGDSYGSAAGSSGGFCNSGTLCAKAVSHAGFAEIDSKATAKVNTFSESEAHTAVTVPQI